MFYIFAYFSIDRPNVDFVIFLSRSHGPSWYKVDIQSLNFRAFRSLCVASYDIFVGCNLNALNFKCGIEPYASNQFSRQLGYCEDISFLPLFSFNHSY